MLNLNKNQTDFAPPLRKRSKPMATMKLGECDLCGEVGRLDEGVCKKHECLNVDISTCPTPDELRKGGLM